MNLTEMPPSRRLSGGRLKTYMAHSAVSISLGSPAEIRKAFHVEHPLSPRRHEVRGHYVHYGIDETCSHEWEPHATDEMTRRDIDRLGRPVPRWRCSNCSGLRVRREAFHRGDASRGFVTKHYEVKG